MDKTGKANSFEGMFSDLAQQSPPNNPFEGIFAGVESGSSVGGKGTVAPKTNFARIREARVAEEEARAFAEKENSFGTLAKRTLNPINLAKGAFSVVKSLATDPKETAKQATLGIANGLTLGGVDYLQRKAFTNAATKYGMDEAEAEQMARTILKPEDGTLAAIRSGFNLAGMVAPYVGIEKAMLTGVKYAAPGWAAQYGRTAKFLTDVGVFNLAGQIEESFKPADERDRKGRAVLDTALAGAFGVGGAVYRSIRKTPFENPFIVQPVTNVNSLIPPGTVVTSDALKVGAQNRLKELSAKKFLRGNEPKELAFLKENVDNPDKLYAFNSNPPKIEVPVPDATAVVTVRVGEEATEQAVKTEGKELSVATNNMDALQSYLKGSNNVDYKIVDDLGKDAKGNKIQARHEFNAKTGRHTIYATDASTASNLSHELGHYFDTSLTKDTSGLSKLIPKFEQNREHIEDTLGSFSVTRLGGEATSEAISADIRAVVRSLEAETQALSAARRGMKAADAPEERFADAVSEILTKEGAANRAPVLTALLKHAEQENSAKLFGESVAKELKAAKIPDDVIAVDGKHFQLSGEALERFKTEKGRSENYLKGVPNDERGQALRKGEGMKMSALKRELTGQYTPAEISKLVERERSNYIGKSVTAKVNGIEVPAQIATRSSFGNVKVKLENGEIVSVKAADIADGRTAKEIMQKITSRGDSRLYSPIAKDETVAERVTKLSEEAPKPEPVVVEKVVEKEVPKELPRTPTGRQPETEAFRAEKITTDADLEVFMNTKVLPKVTGKERISKTNEEISLRSFSSDMTEESFNKILTQRFGNLSEDVVKSKRLIVDKVSKLSETLNGRNIENLSGEELKNAMTEYNQTLEMLEVFAGVRTELSNSFRSLGIAVNKGENDVLVDALEQIRAAIGAERDPYKLIGKLVETRTLSRVEKYFTLWYPSLLSGWKTTARNLTGNFSNLALQTVSTLFTKQGRKEFMPRVMAIVQANKDGLNLARQVLKGEHTMMTKFYEPAVPKEPAFSGKFAFLNKVEYVGRFLNAQDAYFSNAFRSSEVAANRVGKFTYGIENKEAIKAVDEALGVYAGQQGTFRNAFERTFVGEVASTIAKLKTSNVGSVRAFGNFIFPFVKTVANISDRRIDFVPLLNVWRTFGARDLYEQRANRILRDANLHAILKGEGLERGMTLTQAKQYADIEVGRVGDQVIERLRNQQMGRFYMGMSVLTAGVPLAMSGRVTGTGPVGKNERDVLMKTGWRPNSIILPNGVALPYQNLALPIASILSVLGNINDAIKYNKDEGLLANDLAQGIHNFVRSELDQSFLSGLNNIYDSIAGYKKPEQLFADFAANAVPIPAAWTQLKDAVFPDRYDAKTFNEKISTKLGFNVNIFTGEDIQPRLDAFGDQVKADLIYGLTPPLLNSTQNDPVYNFMKEQGVFVGKPQLSTKITGPDGEKRKITREEYTQYVKESGRLIYDDLKDRVASGEFRGMTQEDIEKQVNSMVRMYRNQVKSEIEF